MGWFSNAKIDEFAKQLASDFARHFPGEVKSLPPQKVHGALTQLRMSVVRFTESNALGFFGKTQMANVLKWSLKDVGISTRDADMVVKEALLAVAISERQKKQRNGM